MSCREMKSMSGGRNALSGGGNALLGRKGISVGRGMSVGREISVGREANLRRENRYPPYPRRKGVWEG